MCANLVQDGLGDIRGWRWIFIVEGLVRQLLLMDRRRRRRTDNEQDHHFSFFRQLLHVG